MSSRTHSSGGLNVPVDIEDQGTHYKLTADLPGVKQDDVNLSVHSTRQVCLSAKRSPDTDDHSTDHNHHLVRERRMGSLERCWSLQSSIIESETTASLKDGVLTAMIAKGEAGHTPIRIM